MDKMMRCARLVIPAIVAVFLAPEALAAACTTVAPGGNWNAAATWAAPCNVAGGPVSTDTVTIAHNVTVTANTTVGAVTLINAGTTLTINGVNFIVRGNTNISGTLAHPLLGGTKSYGASLSGTVTINPGGAFTNAGNNPVSFGGNFTHNGATFTSGTGTYTFQLAANASIGGASPITFGGNVGISGAFTVTNNNTNVVTIAGNLTGTFAGSTWVNGINSTLNYGGAAAPMGTRVFTASANPNTVNYTGAGQTVKATIYHHLGLGGSGAKTLTGVSTINGNLTTSGTATATTAANFTIGGNLTVGTGTTFTSANFTNSVTGTTSVTGTLAHSGVAAKTYIGTVTINAGGVWTNAGNAPVTFRGGLTHNGATFTGGTGTQTFNTNSQAIGGASPINFGGIVAVVGAVTVTNNNTNTVTTTGNLTGSVAGSTWVNGINSTLNYGGAAVPMGTRVFTASANPNTVNYTGAAQPIKTPTANTYHNLQFSGSGAKTAAAGLTVNGNLTFSGTATFTAGAFTHNFFGSWIINTTAAAPLLVATTSSINFNTPAIPAATSMGGTTTATIAFSDVNINNTSGVTFNDNASFSTGTTPTLTVAVGATLTPAAAVIISGTGTLTGSGTVQVTRTAAAANFASQYTITTKTLTNLTVEYIGAAAQTVSVLTYGSATGGGLKVSNAGGVSLTANTTVAGTLTLASGAVSTGAFILIASKACNVPSVVRTGGHVAGFLQKNIPVGTPVNCTFEVGDAATYRPIDTTFVSVATAGNLVGSVSQAAGEHPQCCGATPFGLDSAKDVNRYWTLTNPGGIVFTTYSATFNFINPTDFDAGAVPANFEVELWNGAWNTTTFGTRTLTSTQAGGLAAFGDFAVGEKRPTLPGSFNAFETGTAAGAITGKIFTRLAGGAPSLDIVAISGGAQMNTFTNTVTVELLGNQTTGVPLDAQNCPTSFTLIQTVTPNPTITGGRSTVNFAAVANAWKDVRVRVRYPVALPTVTSCSTDNFSIRPTGFTISSTDAGNFNTTGAPAIKTGVSFNLTAASVTGYNGTPVIDNAAGMVVGTPNQGAIGGVFAAAPAATGTAAGNAFFYSEAGNFGLSANAVFDNTFTSVDQPNDCTADFSNTLAGGKYGCNFGSSAVPLIVGSSGFGRFIPDNFNVSYTPPLLGTACGTFGYVGQSLSYTTSPVITVTARNGTANGLTNATTLNYAGAYVKLTNASLAQAPYDTTAGRYSRFDALGGGLTPALDTSGLPPAASDPAIGTFTNGVGALTFGASTGLSFTRSITTPSAPFDADIALALNVADADGVAFAGNPAFFGAPAAGNGIAFSGGKQMRFGRLKLSNAHGSELLNLPVPIQAQYWNGAAFVTNTADNCTTLAANNIKLTVPPAGVSATVGGAFSSGVGSLTLTKPATPAKAAVDMCVDLGADPSVGTVCSATASANLPYLQGLWSPGASYNNDPGARATFGVYKGNNDFIYLRENY